MKKTGLIAALLLATSFASAGTTQIGNSGSSKGEILLNKIQAESQNILQKNSDTDKLNRLVINSLYDMNLNVYYLISAGGETSADARIDKSTSTSMTIFNTVNSVSRDFFLVCDTGTTLDTKSKSIPEITELGKEAGCVSMVVHTRSVTNSTPAVQVVEKIAFNIE